MITVTEATATAGALKRRTDEGVPTWPDDSSRERITSGGPAALVADREVVGVTTDPSTFRATPAAVTASPNAKGADRE